MSNVLVFLIYLTIDFLSNGKITYLYQKLLMLALKTKMRLRLLHQTNNKTYIEIKNVLCISNQIPLGLKACCPLTVPRVNIELV